MMDRVETTYPCCQTKLVVDTGTGEILSEQRPKAGGKSFEAERLARDGRRTWPVSLGGTESGFKLPDVAFRNPVNPGVRIRHIMGGPGRSGQNGLNGCRQDQLCRFGFRWRIVNPIQLQNQDLFSDLDLDPARLQRALDSVIRLSASSMVSR